MRQRHITRIPVLKTDLGNDHVCARIPVEVLTQHPENRWRGLFITELYRQGLTPYYWSEDENGPYCYAETFQSQRANIAAKLASKVATTAKAKQ